jgi:hypothetical protein
MQEQIQEARYRHDQSLRHGDAKQPIDRDEIPHKEGAVPSCTEID